MAKHKVRSAVAGVALGGGLIGVGALLWRYFGWAKVRVANAAIYDDAAKTHSNGSDLVSKGSTATALTIIKGTVVRRTGSEVGGMVPISLAIPGLDQTAWWIPKTSLGFLLA